MCNVEENGREERIECCPNISPYVLILDAHDVRPWADELRAASEVQLIRASYISCLHTMLVLHGYTYLHEYYQLRQQLEIHY